MRGARHALLALAACTLFACDALLGIDVFPDNGSDASAQEAGVEASAEAGVDATTDSHPAGETGVDAGTDVTVSEAAVDGSGDEGTEDAGDDSTKGFCIEMCGLGQARCGATGLQSCEQNDAGCNVWSPEVPCGSGSSCMGAANDAYCCGGGGASCVPSCHWNAGTDAGAGQDDCGRNGNADCCASLQVDGGSYLRGYDGVFNVDDTSPATVSTFQLDEFEVTVGRFRQFVSATVDRHWAPLSGAGIHTHLNGGLGLVDSSQPPTAYESGWEFAWNGEYVFTDLGSWDAYLKCNPGTQTWTTAPGGNEELPVNCVGWNAAYAFCIWDGGFLPTEDEWEYAAMGGGGTGGQRVYAWSTPSSSTTIDCSYANYALCPGGVAKPIAVGVDTKGAGKWGQFDLTGNEWEWTLDSDEAYVTPCTDCAYLTDTALGHSVRGASFGYSANQLYVAIRDGVTPDKHWDNDGFRCARAP